MLRALRATGVDARGVDVRSGATGVTIVRLERNGERTFVDERYGVAAEYRLTAAAVEGLQGCRWVHGAHQPGFEALAAPARRAGRASPTTSATTSATAARPPSPPTSTWPSVPRPAAIPTPARPWRRNSAGAGRRSPWSRSARPGSLACADSTHLPPGRHPRRGRRHPRRRRRVHRRVHRRAARRRLAAATPSSAGRPTQPRPAATWEHGPSPTLRRPDREHDRDRPLDDPLARAVSPGRRSTSPAGWAPARARRGRAGCRCRSSWSPGQGSRLRDVDGNEYVDWTMGLGPADPRPPAAGA